MTDIEREDSLIPLDDEYGLPVDLKGRIDDGEQPSLLLVNRREVDGHDHTALTCIFEDGEEIEAYSAIYHDRDLAAAAVGFLLGDL